VIRHLYGVPLKAAPAGKDEIGFGEEFGEIREESGVVVLRPGHNPGPKPKVFGQKGWDEERKPAPRPAFEALVKGGRWRKPPRGDGRALLKLVEDGVPAKWSEPERHSFACGLGEVLAADPSNRARLLKMHDADPMDPLLATAACWSGTPAAREALGARIAPLAERLASGKTAVLPLLATALLAQERASADALPALLAGLPEPSRDAALRGVGLRSATSLLAVDAAAAADAPAREAVLRRLVALLEALYFAPGFPPAGALPPLVRLLALCLEDGGEAARLADHAGYLLFYIGFRDGPARLDMTSNDVATKGSGERLGPYPDMPAMIRRLDEEIRAGRLVPTDRDVGLFDPPAPDFPAEQGAWTGIEDPRPSFRRAERSSALHARAEKVPGGLRVTLVNAGKTPFAVNPVALRLATAERMDVTVTGEGKARRWSQLDISLGFVRGGGRWTVPSAALVVVAPGGSHAFDVALHPSHEGVERVAFSLHDDMRLPGGSAVPVLRLVGDSWIR
jgi:hypothetical protein